MAASASLAGRVTAGVICWPGTTAQATPPATGARIDVVPQAARTIAVGVAGGLRPAASGGSRPVKWSATGLPPGMAVNYVDGTVSGTPTETGSFTTTLTAVGADGAHGSTTMTWNVTAAATATSWYVDCSATAKGSGTASAPWNNLPAVSAHTFAPGDKLLLKRGTTCTGQLAPKGDGTSDAPITIDAYGSGTAPLVAGNGVAGQRLGGSGPFVGGGAVQLTDQSYWVIQDLQVTNTTANGPVQRDGIDVLVTDAKEHDGITIQHNDVHDVLGISDRSSLDGFTLSHGIGVDLPVDGGFIKGLTIWGNTVHQVHGNGIGLYGDQGTGSNSQAVRNEHVIVSDNALTQVSNDGIVVCVSDSPLIERNTADQLGWDAVAAVNIAGMWSWGATDPTYQFNEVSHILKGSGGDMEAWDCDGHITGTCTYQDNYDHDNYGGIFLNCNGCGGSDHTAIVFRHNVSINDCRIANAPKSAIASFAFYGNTVNCRNTSWSLALPSLTVLSDNIFIGKAGSALPTGVTYRANTYIGFTPPASDSQASTADPHLVNPANNPAPTGIDSLSGYELKIGSPAIGSGVPVAGNAGIDIWEDKVGASTNRGAYIGAGVTG